MKRFLAACVVVAAAVAATARGDIVSWDARTEFSVTNGNPNGVWSYGWMNGSSFQPYTISSTSGIGSQYWLGNIGGDGTPMVWKNNDPNGAYGVAQGQLSLHPGRSEQASIVRWTAPEDFSGTVEVAGQFYAGDGGSMKVAVVLDGNWTSLSWSATNAGQFDLTTSVSAGETIDFAVYGGYNYGNTPLDATITVVPEPGTLTLLAAGMVGLAALLRRKRN